jgi:hypothetical protein
MRAEAVFHQKFYLEGQRYLVEMDVLRVEDTSRFPEGVKYGLICIDRKTGRKVLMDNHHPKGHHQHVGEIEYPYDYRGLDQLIDDFRRLVNSELGVEL